MHIHALHTGNCEHVVQSIEKEFYTTEFLVFLPQRWYPRIPNFKHTIINTVNSSLLKQLISSSSPWVKQLGHPSCSYQGLWFMAVFHDCYSFSCTSWLQKAFRSHYLMVGDQPFYCSMAQSSSAFTWCNFLLRHIDSFGSMLVRQPMIVRWFMASVCHRSAAHGVA